MGMVDFLRRWRSGLSVEARAAFALLCVYLAIMSGHLESWDGLLTYMEARSLTDHGSLIFVPFKWNDQLWSRSLYGVGTSLIEVPPLLIARLVHLSAPALPFAPGGWITITIADFYHDHLFTIAVAPVFAVTTALTAYLVGRFLRALSFGPCTALWGMALFGLASPAVVYARGDFSQSHAALWIILALWSMVRVANVDGQASVIWLGFAVAAAMLTRPLEATLLVGAIAVFVWQSRHTAARISLVRIALAVGSGLVVALAITLAVNAVRWGSPAQSGGYLGLQWWTSAPMQVGLVGALVSPARGILWSFPAVLLVPVAVRYLRTTPARPASLALVTLAGSILLSTATWAIWTGGWDWGLRLFVPAFPLLAVLAAVGVERVRATRWRWVPWPLAALGAVWAAPCVLTDLLGGYAARYSGPMESFSPQAYPPLGAWQFLHRLRAITPEDSGAVDILWFRIARDTGNLSLLIPAMLLALALALTVAIARGLRAETPALPRRYALRRQVEQGT